LLEHLFLSACQVCEIAHIFPKIPFRMKQKADPGDLFDSKIEILAFIARKSVFYEKTSAKIILSAFIHAAL
jgi:hypothetical protein